MKYESGMLIAIKCVAFNIRTVKYLDILGILYLLLNLLRKEFFDSGYSNTNKSPNLGFLYWRFFKPYCVNVAKQHDNYLKNGR